MARRRRDEPEVNVDLDAPEHAWWAASPIDPFGRPDAEATPEATTADPDETPAAATETPAPAPAPPDPYKVLRVDPHATWDDIVKSHRKLARWWHPDGLVDASPDERLYSEERFRELNEAYQDLRIRRGR